RCALQRGDDLCSSGFGDGNGQRHRMDFGLRELSDTFRAVRHVDANRQHRQRDSVTLSVPWMGAAISGSDYSLSQSYYPIPGAKEVTAVKQVVYLDKLSREELNLADPQRLSVGGAPALTWAPAPYLAGVLQNELWPVPSAVLPYVVEYRQTAVTMVELTDIPMVPAAVLEAKAM